MVVKEKNGVTRDDVVVVKQRKGIAYGDVVAVVKVMEGVARGDALVVVGVIVAAEVVAMAEVVLLVVGNGIGSNGGRTSRCIMYCWWSVKGSE